MYLDPCCSITESSIFMDLILIKLIRAKSSNKLTLVLPVTKEKGETIKISTEINVYYAIMLAIFFII